MTKSQMFKKAHAIAKTLEGNYSVRLSMGLKQVWSEIKSLQRRNMITLKMNGHTISESSVTELNKWDKTVNGYSGTIAYSQNGKTYMPNVTKSEIAEFVAFGLTSTFIPTKYTGTY